MEDSPTGWWVTPYHFGIDQGPVVLMIENYRTGLIWDVMRRCVPVLTGLRRGSREVGCDPGHAARAQVAGGVLRGRQTRRANAGKT